MKWIAESRNDARSDCGNYHIRGGYVDGNYWRATHVASDKLVVASSDKEFVKLRCEIHAKIIGSRA